MTSPRGPGRFPVFATYPVVISAHSETIANQGEKKKAGHCEFHSSQETSSMALGVPGTPYLTAWANSGKSGREQMAGPRDPGRFPVFATCPVVILAHSQTIADQGEKKDGYCELHSSRKTSSTASSPWPFKIHSRPLQPRPEWGGMLEPGGAGPRPERSIRPRLLPTPAG